MKWVMYDMKISLVAMLADLNWEPNLITEADGRRRILRTLLNETKIINVATTLSRKLCYLVFNSN